MNLFFSLPSHKWDGFISIFIKGFSPITVVHGKEFALDRNVQSCLLIPLRLQIKQLRIPAIFRQQLPVATNFQNFSFIQHQYPVG